MRNHEAAIEVLLNSATREAIIDYINQYGDPIAWDGWTTRQILSEVSRSDIEAGEDNNGILAAMFLELA